MNKNKIKLNLNLYSYGYSLNFLNLNIKKTKLDSLLKQHTQLKLNGIELPIDTLFSNIKNFDNFILSILKNINFVCFDNISNLNYNYLDYLKKSISKI